MWDTLIPAALGFAGSLFGGDDNPGDAVGSQLNRIPQYGYDAYNPFIEQGKQASQQLFPIQNQQAQNPADYYNNILSQYKPSQGYQYRQNQLTKGLSNTAASGGFAGTENHQNAYGELVNSLMGQDMQQFLSNILGIQQQGSQGLEHQVNRGFHSAGNLADYLGGVGGAQAQNAGAGMDYGNQGNAGVYSALSGLIKPLGGLLGGGKSRAFGGQGPVQGGYGGQSWGGAQKTNLGNMLGGRPWG